MKYNFVLLVLSINLAKCAKILVVLPSPGYSQYMLVEPLLLAMAAKNHDLTVISAFGTKNNKNIENVLVDLNMGQNMLPEMLFELQDLNIFRNTIFLNEFGLNITEKLLSNKQVQQLIHSGEKFDLVLLETFFNEAHHAFAAHFDAHKILIHSMALNEWNSHLISNPNNPSYLPNSFGGYTTNMNFKARFRNSMALWFGRFYNYFIQYPSHQNLIDRYFPAKYDLNKLIYNSSLMLACSHVGSTESTPLTASVIEVGGMHIIKKNLPDNIQEFLDSAPDGVIFFSLGSNIQSSSLPRSLIRDIVTAIGKLQQKVLWKFEDSEMENKPDNLMVAKWFPQSDILAHPNTKLFISHCGMGSTTEAIYYGVPVIGIPIYGDQFMNIRRLILFGMGYELPLKKLNGKTFGDSIREVLQNSEYKERAKTRSKIMLDRPMKPLDSAIYWIEYVLRHNGAHHLKSSISNLSWYQLYLIDVILAIAFAIIFGVFIVFVIVQLLKRQIFKQKID